MMFVGCERASAASATPRGTGLHLEEVNMSDVVKVIEVLAQSEKGWEDAAAEAVKQASKTLKNIKSIYIENLEATVEGNKIRRYRVNAKISFQLE